MSAAAYAALAAQIARVQALPLALPEIARRVADAAREIIAGNVAAGRGPDGAPWPATKDGHAALVSAMDSISVVALGTEIVITVDGVEARHHLGAIRGHVARPLIPTRGIPTTIAQACERVTLETLGEIA